MSLLVEHLKKELEVYELHPEMYEDPDVASYYRKHNPVFFMGKQFDIQDTQLILGMIEKELVNV